MEEDALLGFSEQMRDKQREIKRPLLQVWQGCRRVQAPLRPEQSTDWASIRSWLGWSLEDRPGDILTADLEEPWHEQKKSQEVYFCTEGRRNRKLINCLWLLHHAVPLL